MLPLRLLHIALLLASAAIGAASPAARGTTPPTAPTAVIGPTPRPFVQFDLRIPGVTEEMLSADYWIARIPNPDQPIMSATEVERYNRNSLRQCDILEDLRAYPLVMAGERIIERIRRTSARPGKPRYLGGKQLGDDYFAALERGLAVERVASFVPVRFGITVRRTEMRTFPTHDRVFSEPDDYEFDRFIETALYPVEPLAILHTSADGAWFYAQAYNYLSWVPASDVALIDRTALFTYLDTPDFLVVTGKHVFTGFNPLRPEISELQFDMGVRLPLAHRDEIPEEIDGQHPAGNWVVKLPVRTPEGRVDWRLGLISRSDDVRVGYLPFTRRHLITQAFKFLGQRYGWGGMFNTRDCSAFIMDNFRTMGVFLPRNAGEQGKLALGRRHDLPKTMDLEERKRIFDRLPAATPVYMDGHAMLYLGPAGDDYYIIHDVAGVSSREPGGEIKRSKARGVLVTPLLATFLSSGRPYLEGLYAAREFVFDPREPQPATASPAGSMPASTPAPALPPRSGPGSAGKPEIGGPGDPSAPSSATDTVGVPGNSVPRPTGGRP